MLFRLSTALVAQQATPDPVRRGFLRLMPAPRGLRQRRGNGRPWCWPRRSRWLMPVQE